MNNSFIKRQLSTASGRFRFLLMIPCVFLAFWGLGSFLLTVLERHNPGNSFLFEFEPNGMTKMLLGMAVPLALFEGVGRARQGLLQLQSHSNFGEVFASFPTLTLMALMVLWLPVHLVAGVFAAGFVNIMAKVGISLVISPAEHPQLFSIITTAVVPLIVLYYAVESMPSFSGPTRQNLEKGRDLTSQDEAELEAERLSKEQK